MNVVANPSLVRVESISSPPTSNARPSMNGIHIVKHTPLILDVKFLEENSAWIREMTLTGAYILGLVIFQKLCIILSFENLVW